MALSHLSVVYIPVRDQELAKDFYVNKLGFEVVMDLDVSEELRWLQLRLPNALTSIAPVMADDHSPAGTIQGLVFEVDDLDATIADLQAKGVTTPAIESASWGSWVLVEDPDGNHILLQKSVTPPL